MPNMSIPSTESQSHLQLIVPTNGSSISCSIGVSEYPAPKQRGYPPIASNMVRCPLFGSGAERSRNPVKPLVTRNNCNPETGLNIFKGKTIMLYNDYIHTSSYNYAEEGPLVRLHPVIRRYRTRAGVASLQPMLRRHLRERVAL